MSKKKDDVWQRFDKAVDALISHKLDRQKTKRQNQQAKAKPAN